MVPVSKASHNIGGEITWKCLSNGRYVFYAKLYGDCSAIPIVFGSFDKLELVGNPLPRDANNVVITEIQLIPDSVEWIRNHFGDITSRSLDPSCQIDSIRVSCENRDELAIQEFPFKSAPIRLYGTPPSSGWKFYLTQPCCRPTNVVNLAGSGTHILRATMYASSQGTSNGNCNDSSPRFYESPQYLFSRGQEMSYQFSANDPDGDSLVYRFSRTYNTPPAAPQPVRFRPGYSINNPTDDQFFDPSNRPMELNSTSSLVEFAVFSGSPFPRPYQIVNQIDAYKDGQLVSSTFRDHLLYIYDPIVNSSLPKPEILIDGKAGTTEINVLASLFLKKRS